MAGTQGRVHRRANETRRPSRVTRALSLWVVSGTERHLPVPRLFLSFHALPGLYRGHPPIRTIAQYSGVVCILIPIPQPSNGYLQKWTSEFFAGITLRDLGATYQLGHPAGERCALPSPAVDLTLFDISGVKVIRIRYCYCGAPGQQLRPRVQLLRARWFPATLKQPSTAFTFRLLDFLHKLQTRSKINLYDVYATLISIHNPAGLGPPIVSMRSLLTDRSSIWLSNTTVVSLQRTCTCLPCLGRSTTRSSCGWSQHEWPVW